MKFLDRSEQIKTKLNETEKYLQRQQDIDALLVLARVCELGTTVSIEVIKKAESKISNLIEKV